MKLITNWKGLAFGAASLFTVVAAQLCMSSSAHAQTIENFAGPAQTAFVAIPNPSSVAPVVEQTPVTHSYHYSSALYSDSVFVTALQQNIVDAYAALGRPRPNLGHTGDAGDGIDGIYGRLTSAAWHGLPAGIQREVLEKAYQLTQNINRPGPSSAQYETSQPQAVTPKGTTAVFDMSTRQLVLPDGEVFDAGSGLGAGHNNPEYQANPNEGPVPLGVWNVGAPSRHNLILIDGRVDSTETLELLPARGTDTKGRDGLLIHHAYGRNLFSEGCVVLPDKQMKRLLEARQRGVFDRLIVTYAPLPQPREGKRITVNYGKPALG